MNRTEYEKRTEELIMPVIGENSFELVDVEFVKEGQDFYLRAYIDKEGGITIDDCEIVSRALSDMLDREDFISEPYILEVSSPGLTRPLKKEKDYARSVGRRIEVKLFKAQDKRREFEGILKEYDENMIVVVEDSGESITIMRNNISLIRLAFCEK